MPNLIRHGEQSDVQTGVHEIVSVLVKPMVKPMAKAAMLLCSVVLLAPGTAVAQASVRSEPAVVVPGAIAQLQVMAVSLSIRAAPDAASAILAQVQRGSLLSVQEQRGDWFKVALPSSLSGWVQKAPADFGQMTVEPVSGNNPVTFALDAVGAESARDAGRIVEARPGHAAGLVTLPPIDSQQVAPPQANLPRESVSIPDRWRLMQALGFKFPLFDPYHQNPLKGDLPVLKNLGDDLFFDLGVISDTTYEARRLPTPVSGQVSIRPGANDVFGQGKQHTFSQNLIVSLDLLKGDTTFRPPDYEFKFVPLFNYNRTVVQEAGALNIDPSTGTSRTDNFVGVQELFGDVHLRNVSERYDFDSVRFGVQPFTADFRGFLFQDSPFGIRLFGNRDNNQYQYNLAWFRRFEKDTNSGLNDVGKGLRKDDVFVANLYRQDWPFTGFTSQFSIVHNRNNETEVAYDTNGFLIRPAFVGDLRPHKYQVTYLGYNGDGHIGLWNLSTSVYGVFGTDDHNPIAQQAQQIQAGFFAAELSRDINWIRIRGNVLVASGDKNPFDKKATGFDAILENPQFAGSDTNFFIRQALPLIGGGGVSLAGRNSILPSLRSSSDEGQSNFVNPGISLIGLGADVDVAPELRMFANVSSLRFMNTSSLAYLLNQTIPSNSIGTDYSIGFHYRPFFSQNTIINGSAAVLKPGSGLRALYGNSSDSLYSIVLNVVLTF